MGRMPYLAFLWPGLPLILANGSWLGLAEAVGFALLVNLLLFASLWWPELLQTHFRSGIWLVTGVFWAGATVTTSRALRQFGPVDDSAAKATLGDATRRYLGADWFGAEQILVDLLRNNARDVDAGLMLATLWRHTGRVGEALQQLDRLELLEESRKWALEIHLERKQLEEAQKRLRASSENVLERNVAA